MRGAGVPFLVSRQRPRAPGVGAVAVAIAAGALIWISVRGELEGLARLPAGALAVLLASAPIFVALFDWIASRKVPSRFERVAMIGIVGGVAVMAAPVGASVNQWGVLAGLVSAATFAALLFVEGRNPRVSPELGFPLAMIGAALTVLVTDPSAPADLSAGLPTWLVLATGVTAAGWALLVGVGLGATSAVTAAMVVAAEPVLVAVLAYLMLGETLTLRQLAGGFIVVATLAAVAARLYFEGSPDPA